MEALQIPVTLYIHLNNSQFATEKYLVTTCDMSRGLKDYILLETRQIIVPFTEPEPFDLIERQVSSLRDKKAEIQHQADTAVTAIDDQIQQLLCIDHTPVDEDEIPY
ncbi:hypothetical protein FEM41_14690 [Jejubacter calystegiae]|uniref:Uncharacterized protein n=1 Tax=Jejubacter calystegiae TaxID=2579935 RepID=A0A4P8YJA0_9ENTR|nr:hypothetical protein [Jejubacter calystegiae]QCT20805.1 hypothetical protein FEM41_14690 [Jejubacter calystegiae]